MRFPLSLLLGLITISGSSIAQETQPSAGVVYTQKKHFRIPYHFDQAEMQRIGAREIRLYVSDNQGERWQLAQSVPARSGKFLFKAPQDGEYWFSVRTLDNRNQLHPGGRDFQPGLKVAVDTVPPQIDIQLQQINNRVQLAWTATDTNLDVSKLVLEYKQTGEPGWTKVEILPQPAGQTSWSVKPGAVVAVRGSITDKAENNGQGSSQIQIRGNNRPQPDISDYTKPVAKSNRLPSFNSQESVAQGDPQSGILTPDPFASASRNNDNSLPDKTRLDSSNFGTRGNVKSNIVSSPNHQQPSITSGRFSSNSQPQTSRQFPEGARVVNTQEFEIGYQVEDVGPSGIGDIEFFITQDGGQKWWRYGDDKDKQSPFQVRVPKDGVYGFTMRVRSGVGLVEPPPQPGDKPDIVVAVDQTAPLVQMLNPQQGTGASLNKILLRWKTDEEFPANKPIAIAYSASPDGPWENITNWSEDRGSYLWTVVAGMPSKVYVQLSVRDAAGNVSRVKSAQPILVDLSRPTARILDVETNKNSRFER